MDLFWSMLWFFLFFAWIWLLITIFSDIFRSDDLSGWGKAFWTIFVVILPWLGVLIYLIARGGSMQERAMAQAVAAGEGAERVHPAGLRFEQGASSADELEKLAKLQSQGVISAEEFAAQKAKILA